MPIEIISELILFLKLKLELVHICQVKGYFLDAFFLLTFHKCKASAPVFLCLRWAYQTSGLVTLRFKSWKTLFVRADFF